MDYRGIINEFRHHPWLATVLVTLVIGSNAWTIAGTLYQHDPHPDYANLRIDIFTCDPWEVPRNSEHIQRNTLKYWFHCLSYHYTGTVKTIPLIFNIGVMPMVYLVALRLTNDRLLSLIALVAFINNPLYRDWYTSAVYDNIWSFFVLLSVYLIYSKPVFGFGSFILGILSKGIAIMYLPAWAYTAYRVKKSKTIPVMVGAMIGVILVMSLYMNIAGSPIGFYPERWEDAIYRNISVLWQVIPFLALFVIISRNFRPRNKVPNENIAWVWMLCAILQNPLIYFFTLQDTYSYRYVPFAAFFSIFIGMTLVNLGNWIQERQLAKSGFINDNTH